MARRVRDDGMPEISEELIQKVAGAVSSGNYLPAVAAYVGLTRDQLYVWVRRGARERRETWDGGRAGGLYAQLHRAVEHALASAEMRCVVQIQQAAQGGGVISRKTTTKKDKSGEDVVTVTEVMAKPDWQASAWWLERMYPQRWGKHETVRHEHEMMEEGREDDRSLKGVEETFLPDPKRRLALRIAAARMLERERERIEGKQAAAAGGGGHNRSGGMVLGPPVAVAEESGNGHDWTEDTVAAADDKHGQEESKEG